MLCFDMAVCWAIRNKCCSPHNPTTCTLDTACLSYLGEHRLPSGLCLPADHGIKCYTYPLAIGDGKRLSVLTT